ncbi:MAG: fibronectin type III domain-containing protein [bacterium]
MASLTRIHWRNARLVGTMLATALGMLLMISGLTGCNDNPIETVNEDELAPPLGLESITGNGRVTLTWFTSNFEDDFEGYIVFQANGDHATDQSSEIDTIFTEVDRVEFNSSGSPRSVTIDGLTNGTTYSFAIVAFEDDGDKVSRTSNIISDTPRPSINTITITSASTNDVSGNDATAGFDFDGFDVTTVPNDLAGNNYTDTNGSDIVHEAFDPGPENDNIRSWLSGMNGGDVQDLGFMGDLDDADVAPEEGYSQSGESVILTVGHVYAIHTGNNRFAKLIVTAILPPPNARVTFNAAFQTKLDDPNYKQSFDDDRALGIARARD